MRSSFSAAGGAGCDAGVVVRSSFPAGGGPGRGRGDKQFSAGGGQPWMSTENKILMILIRNIKIMKRLQKLSK